MHGSMQNVAPVLNQAHRGGMLRLAFLSAVVSLVVAFAVAAAPIPLYNIYRGEDGFTNSGISMAIVAYAVGTIAALLVLGRLSNHLGRRLTAIANTRYETIEWVMWQMGEVGPMFGQVGFFNKFAGKAYEDNRPRDRYASESARLLGVLDERLAGRDWVMGADYSIADVRCSAGCAT